MLGLIRIWVGGIDLVVEFVGFVLVVDSNGEDGCIGQGNAFRFIHFGVPL